MPEAKYLDVEMNYLNCHWRELLKCPVCLAYFRDPVSLFCGHSFCKRCLTKMAHNTRMQRPDIPLSRLQMWCPTCRHAVPVCLYVGPGLNVCYVLRDLVLLLMLFRPASVSCRSISTQTKLPCTTIVPRGTWSIATASHSDISVEERLYHMKTDSMVPLRTAEYYDSTCSDKNENRRDLAPDLSESDMYDSDDDSTEDDPQFNENMHDADVVHRQELTRRRMWMLVFWIVYTVIMAIISHGFLPYIIVYSLVLLLIIYVDSMQYQAIENMH
ncbi:uncharacterized protein LOC121367554 isoform X2 [Gigantopelta aegis]|uniref:uncharacterized protein LOC121367554 isoform X2 n=1 Tax=Gigantopelta aegis TaxID=1735272 RepID=UPI001B88DAE7|nr:uncharacterized protein LOC121367554 isoform X2 [Gigantopelta aegis]